MPRTNGVVLSFLITVAPLISSAPAWADTPVLYSSPAYESPVRGDPDDLLLISGSGLSAADTVVYQALGDTTQTAVHPASIPASSTATLGVADLVSSADAPYSLTVHLPAVMSPGRAYGLWVVTPDNQWSTELRINDARPLWITPDSGYQTASLAGLPRVLKVVGRNLQPDPNATGATQVRLLGQHTGTTYILTGNNTSNDPTHTTATLERYVAAVNLPSPMVADQYSVQVSRDDTSWVALLEDGRSPPQTFWVKPDPATPPTFDVSAFAGGVAGPCLPNDGVDDTACILLAIRAAQAAGGGTVTFGPGTWLISKIGPWYGQFSDLLGLYAPGLCAGYFDTCAVTYFGLFVPLNVNLRGAGASGANSTIIERGAYTGQPTDWPATWSVFTFQGNSVVSGFRFIDDNDYLNDYANQGLNGDFELQLGATWFFAQLYGASLPLTVSNIVITDNVFDKPFVAIGNGGLPADHIYITYNTFGGAFSTGIEIAEDENNVGNLGSNPRFAYQGFHWNDTVVSHNTFYPSSFQAAPTGDPRGSGTVATQLNTGLREDFSDNVADGTSTQYFYSPTDPKGWRAAFFWSTGANQEMTLVSNNNISCPGDKYGDGEAIAYDGDGALGGMPSAQPVVAAAPWIDPQGVAGTTLSVQGAVATQLPSSSGTVDISANPTLYYQGGFWLQVVQGKGKGQWRKVESLSLGTNSAGSTVTLNVTPAFDVVPDTGSKVILGRAYWQNATVDNTIDQRTPLCTKANGRDRGGTVVWYGSTADSAMDDNQLYDTTGIYLNHTYQPQQPSATPVKPGGFVLQAYNEVRNNLVTGAYDWSVNGRTAGIELGLGATGWFCDGNTCPAPPPPTTGFGVSIAKNVVSRTSARDSDGSVNPPMGGISSSANWETGVLDALGLSMWQLGDATLIFSNTLQDISNTVSGSAGGLPLVGIGIDVAQGSTLTPAITWRSTLYNNTCNNVDKPTSDFGLATVRYCPTGHAASCECSSVATVDVGVTATSNSGSVSAGGSVTYTITLTNNDVSTIASDVNLSLEPSAGVQISGSSFTASQGTCDVSVNICLLGSLAAGQSATVTVTGTLPNTGNWPVTFSVTHAEADSVPRNDSATVTESVL
jgi:hypothetical protein